MHQKAAFSHSMWAVYRYIDPIGLILAVVSNVPFSKPFMFRVRDKKNKSGYGDFRILYISGCFAFCICSLHFDLFGLGSILQQDPLSVGKRVVLADNIWHFKLWDVCGKSFPVSVFDIGLIVAGTSAKKYLQIIKRMR